MDSVVDPEHGFSFGEADYSTGGVYGPLTRRYVTLLMMHEGSAKVTCDGEVTIVENGQCGFILCEGVSLFEYEKGQRDRVSWCEGFPASLPESVVLRLRDVPSQIPITDRLATLVRLGLELGSGTGAYVNMLRNNLGQSLFTAYFHEAQVSELERHIPRSIHQARRYLEDNFEKEMTVGHVANVVAVTPQHLISSFRKHIGVTPVRYLWQIRANRGKQRLLHTGLTISEIAYQCGYKNPFHFSRQIKLHFGMSPTELRANMDYRKPSRVAENAVNMVF